MGGNAFPEATGPISKADIEATLKYISPIVGIPYSSKLDKKGKITKYGLEDSTMGSAGKTNAGVFGKKDMVGDIDIAVDENEYDFDKLVSRLIQKIGPENVARPMKGLGVIPTKMPIAGNESKGFVQVDFMFGDPKLLTFTYSSPDPESMSKFKGAYRNILMATILQNMRRQVRDSETQEIIALVGPSLLLNKGVIQQWRHFPLRKDGDGRLTTMRAISREEFDKLYPDHKGKEKEFTLDSPDDIIDFIFPKANAKPSDLDSYEKLRDLIIKHMPEQSEDIFNRFANSLQKQGFDVPEGLVVETVAKVAAVKVLRETRMVSMEMVSESIVRRGKFDDFRSKCSQLLTDSQQMDHFVRPKATADLMPQEGFQYIMKKSGLMDDWTNVNKADYANNYSHMANDFSGFYGDLCELMREDDFFFVTEHYGLKITPESFVASLIDMEYSK